MSTKYVCLLISAIATTTPAIGATTESTHTGPYAGQEQRAIKALSPQDIADLETGRGMGLSKVAELNHYPGPKHVLELAEPLALTDAQARDVKQIEVGMQQSAQRLGKQILSKEAELERLFVTYRSDDKPVRALITEIGRLQGELRFVHVDAHLSTTRLLSTAQVATYDRLRGYVGGSTPTHHNH